LFLGFLEVAIERIRQTRYSKSWIGELGLVNERSLKLLRIKGILGMDFEKFEG
jgi:hypothetical protein